MSQLYLYVAKSQPHISFTIQLPEHHCIVASRDWKAVYFMNAITHTSAHTHSYNTSDQKKLINIKYNGLGILHLLIFLELFSLENFEFIVT